MMDKRKSFLLRMDPELWAEVEAWAAAELRSVNGQVEYLLRQAVARRRGAVPDPGPARSDTGSAHGKRRGP